MTPLPRPHIIQSIVIRYYYMNLDIHISKPFLTQRIAIFYFTLIILHRTQNRPLLNSETMVTYQSYLSSITHSPSHHTRDTHVTDAFCLTHTSVTRLLGLNGLTSLSRSSALCLRNSRCLSEYFSAIQSCSSLWRSWSFWLAFPCAWVTICCSFSTLMRTLSSAAALLHKQPQY